MDLPGRKIFTVTELTSRIKEFLEGEYSSVWIQGEISNYRPSPSGHIYFTLKDESSQIRCVLFKLQSRFLKFRPEEGLQIIAWGRLSVYAVRGEYQLILDTMEPAGIGSLMLGFEQLKKRLAAEGLFDAQRKKPIPRFPKRVGIVTSSRGAAVHDILRIIKRRFPGTYVLISPATVQGDRAPEEIIAAIERLCQAGEIEVIIVGRGGGSVEDLWAFNDEKVVRSIASCPLPVVTAVGHETDFTLSDFASDLRAPTPSAAAEMLIPDRLETAQGVEHLAARLSSCIQSIVNERLSVLAELTRRIYDPRRLIRDRQLRVDDLISRLIRGVHRKLEELQKETASLAERLRPNILVRKIENYKAECSNLSTRLSRCMNQISSQKRGNLQHLVQQLDTLSPLAVLARGYSITSAPASGNVIQEASQVEIGEELNIQLQKGRLVCRVQQKTDGNDNGPGN